MAIFRECGGKIIVIEHTSIPQLIRERLPRFTPLVDEWVGFMGADVTNYPLVSALFTKLIEEWKQKKPGLQNESDVKVFFEMVENVLMQGDQSARDLFVIEVIERLFSPEVANLDLQRFLGPKARQQWNTHQKYLASGKLSSD